MMSPLTPEELEKAAQRLSAGRIIALEKQPYLAKSMLAMIPYAREGLGTFAVDVRWRMYYDPRMCLEWTVEEIAAVWLHECSHLIRNHAQRFEEAEGQSIRYREEWNHAADAAINSDLEEIDIRLPDPGNRFYARSNLLYPDWAPGMTTEQLFAIAKGSSDQHDENGNNASSDPSNDNPEGLDKPEDSGSPSDGDDSYDRGSEDEGKDKDQKPGGSTGDSDSTNEGNHEGDTLGEGSGSQSDDGEKDSPEENAPNTHDCGSGASGGGKRDYEEDSIDDGSLDPFDVDRVLEETARDIADAASRGTVPGGLLRDVDDILNPKVDWGRELSRWMRRTVAQIMGQSDYSFSRRSRASMMTQFYLPGLRDRQPPVVKIVLDTSGSMSTEDLTRGLSEICAILEQTQRNSGEPVEIIICDAAANDIVAIRDISQLELHGGGGTDMRVGMNAAAEARPAADVILVITDGGTPWPEEPPFANRRAKYVVLLVDQGIFSLDDVMDQIPRWIDVIPTYR